MDALLQCNIRRWGENRFLEKAKTDELIYLKYEKD